MFLQWQHKNVNFVTSRQKLLNDLGVVLTTIKDWKKDKRNIETYSMTVKSN